MKSSSLPKNSEAPKNWWKLLDQAFSTEKSRKLFLKLDELYKSGARIFPERSKIFRAFLATPFDQVKVVIVGQDPYPTPGVADGLAFSTSFLNETPPSLKNIFKEIKREYGETPVSKDLRIWTKQGVLLLNRTLTVEAGKPASHRGLGWEEITHFAIEQLSESKKDLVFILWGNDAQKLIPTIRAQGHFILFSAHPSPLSANRGFFGCNHFRQANEFLVQTGQTPIDWVGKVLK